MSIQPPFWNEKDIIALDNELLVRQLLQAARAGIDSDGLDLAVNLGYYADYLSDVSTIDVFDLLAYKSELFFAHANG